MTSELALTKLANSFTKVSQYPIKLPLEDLEDLAIRINSFFKLFGTISVLTLEVAQEVTLSQAHYLP